MALEWYEYYSLINYMEELRDKIQLLKQEVDILKKEIDILKKEKQF